MTVRITTLVENTVSWANLLGEWGLSMLVETDDYVYLSDAGTTDAAARNAKALGVSLSAVEAITISHGHFDHTGGIPYLLPLIRKSVQVIGHPAMWGLKYAYHPGQQMCGYDVGDDYEYIGIPFAREELEKWGARFVMEESPVWLSDSVVTSGEVPMVTDYETIDPMLLVRENGEYQPDPLRDDLSTFIKTDKGLIAVLGCAHRGIVNHLLRGQELTGMDRVYAAVGGTHLIAADSSRLEKTVKALKKMGVQKIAASHCTGLRAACVLEREFGDAFVFNNAGSRLTL